MAQTHQLFAGYLEGDVDRARQSLDKRIQLFESSKALEPCGQAGILFLEYSRLYALEKRAGTDAKAESALIKARYWALRNLELKEVPTNEAITKIRSYSTDKILEMVDEFDKEPSHGMGPKYAHHG